MKSLARIAISVVVLGALLVAGLALAHREKKADWSDFIEVKKIRGEEVAGAWALNGWTGYMGTALQLEGGHFRYWFYSDVINENAPKYPVSGTYRISGTKIILSSSSDIRDRIWIHGFHDGIEGLWAEPDLEVIIKRAESPSVRMLRRVSNAVDPQKPIYNTESP